MNLGAVTVLGSNWNAASWNGPTIEPLLIQPKSPYNYRFVWWT